MKHSFFTFLFKEYYRRILNYLKRVTLSFYTHMLGTTELVAISIETSKLDIKCFLEKNSLNSSV